MSIERDRARAPRVHALLPRKRLPQGARREQLLEVAVRAFGEGGYAGTSTADIAREAGISAPALYRHYPSKKALYLSALEHAGERMFTQWESAAEEAPNALVALARVGLLYQHMMTHEPHLVRMRFRALSAIDEPEVRKLVLRNHRRAERLATRLARRAEREGLLAPGITKDMLVAGFLAWGAMTDVSHHLGLRKSNDVFARALADAMRHLAL